MAERKPRTFGLWMAVAGLSLPFLYLLTIGFLIRMEARGHLRDSMLPSAVAYSIPYNWACDHLPDALKPAVEKFEDLWLP